MTTANEISSAFDKILPPSAFASSSTPRKKVSYDVFINHRGPDTKQTLAASIYRTLKLIGLEVFLDESELQIGDSIPSQIQDAMVTSFLNIVILSPRYAESTWCLTELSFMLETNKKIIPVFYNVDPSDIHWICKGKGIYAKAFSEHEAKARYTSQTLEDWKLALQKISYVKGSIVKNEDDEGMLKNIVDYILKHQRKISLVVAEHPVGLDEIVQDFERSVLETLEKVKIVGIIGMGGCGKTTLAKEYYNKKIFSIYRCSFVYNVRDTLAKNLHEKQKKMFQDLGGSKDVSFDNVEEGKMILAEHLKSVQVFIILDDVDHLDQLHSLLPIKNNIREGSVIVVTSRDVDILTSWGISSNSIYKMKKLKLEHAIELFCWHAFPQRSPIKKFEYLIKKFLEVCKGLPLSLKVLGGLVHGKSKEYWEAQLNKVSRSMPEDIKNILKVSFDALDEEDKEIFLDISCFFIGTERDSAITVWDGSGWSGLCSLVTLANKCLIEVDGRNCIRMHDQLRDLGNEITKTWPTYRLLSSQQITHFEKQGQESVLIRGIKAETDEFYEECMELVRGSGRRFKQKRGLEILHVKNNYFTEELATLAAGPIWLRWVNFPHKALQSWTPLKKLRVLELREASKLEQLWSESADPPVELRELKIIHAGSFQKFPRSIGFLKNLKNICFDSNGAPIEALPEEFCRLQSLEHLELSGCHKLKSLPNKFGDLRNLRRLYLTECSGIEDLPEEFCSLQSLQHLELNECCKLKSLPRKFGNLTNLQGLYFRECSELTCLPETLAQLTSLQYLKIDRCALTELVIQSGYFPSSLCSLRFFIVWGCPVSRISISQQCCPSMENIHLGLCHHLVEIDSLPISVKSLYLISCPNLKSINSNCGLVELKQLVIWECGELKKIEGLENCRSLEMLITNTWRELPVIQSPKHMESLRRISVSVECHISGFESSHLNTQPSECIMWAAPGVEAIVKSCTFPGLSLVDSCGQEKTFTFSDRHSSNEAAIVCFGMNSASDNIHPTLQTDCGRCRRTKVEEGKWVYIGVFTQSSPLERDVEFELWTSSSSLHNGMPDVDCGDAGMLAMGEEKRVMDAFYELLQHLTKEVHIHEN